MAADPRWLPLEGHRDAMLASLSLGLQIWAEQDRRTGALDRRMVELAFQKAFQDAYPSFEQAALGILDLAGEPRPVGQRWHEDLLLIITRASANRPALAADLADDLDELRQFRHIAMHGYVRFRVDRAAPAVSAAERLIVALPGASDLFGRDFGLLPTQAG